MPMIIKMKPAPDDDSRPTPAGTPARPDDIASRKLLVPSLLHGVYDAVLVCDLTGEILASNERMERLFKFTREGLSGRSISVAIPNLRGDILNHLVSGIDKGHFSVIQANCQRQDGVKFTGEVAIGRLDLDGKERLVLSIRKIDQREKSEGGSAAAPSTAQAAPFRDLLMALYEAVLISDPAGTILEANKRAADLLGHNAPDLLQKKIGDVVSGFDDSLLQRVRGHLAEGRFIVLEAYCLRKDESSFPAEIAISRIRYWNQEDLVFSMRNIERRRRQEDLLKTSHNALQNSASGIVIADDLGHITFANTTFSRFVGINAPEELNGRNILEFCEGDDSANRLISSPLAGETWIGEITLHAAGGRKLFVQASSSQNRDSRNQSAGIVMSFVDITERKKAEEAIRREAEAQMKRAREQNEFSGLLNVISIPDVLQLIDVARKTGWLRVTDADNRIVAEMAFNEGRLASASCGTFTGEPAVYELMRRGGSAFNFEKSSVPDMDPTITNSTMGIVLEGSRLLDEAIQQGSV